MKVIATTDGRYAIVERKQVTRNIAIWSPIDERRWETQEEAELVLRLKALIKEEPVVEKPKVTIDRSNLPNREDLRITKLEKGVFAIEQRKFGRWVEVKTCKTRTKAEEWCATNSK